MMEEILQALLTGGEQALETAVIKFVGMLRADQPAALNETARLMDDPDPDVRWWTVRLAAATIAVCDDGILEVAAAGQLQAILLAAMDDADMEVRQCAMLALRGHPLPEAAPGLLEALSSSDALLARLAGNALIALEGQAVPGLLAMVKNGPPAARREAVRALAEIGDPRAIPALFQVSGEESSMLQYWADKGLEKMGVGTVYFSPG